MEPRALAVLALALVAAVVDVRTERIPNGFNVFVWVVGLAAAFAAPLHGASWPVGGAEALVTSIAVLGVGFVVFQLGSIGGGDVKLAAALGAWLGPIATIEVLIYSTCAATAMVLGMCAVRGRLWAFTRTFFAATGGALFPSLRVYADEELLAARMPLAVSVFLGAVTWFVVARPGF